MSEALDVLLEILENGLTLVTILAIINVIVTWIEARRKLKVYQRTEHKIDLLLKEAGIECGQQNECSKDHPICGRFCVLSLVAQQRQVGRSSSQRRKRNMKLSKTWLVGLLGYVAFFVKQFTGYEISDELINNVADLILLVIMIIPMVVNMTKKKGGDDDADEEYQNTFESHQ